MSKNKKRHPFEECSLVINRLFQCREATIIKGLSSLKTSTLFWFGKALASKARGWRLGYQHCVKHPNQMPAGYKEDFMNSLVGARKVLKAIKFVLRERGVK